MKEEGADPRARSLVGTPGVPGRGNHEMAGAGTRVTLATSHRPRRRAPPRRRPCHDGRMDFALSPELEALREHARRFVVDELQPLEVPFERAGGKLPKEQG